MINLLKRKREIPIWIEKNKSFKIQKERSIGVATSYKIIKIMNEYINKSREIESQKVKIFTSNEYSQEFLNNLIPKRGFKL